MYGETARYYDLIYSWKNYPADVHRIVSIIEQLAPNASSLLDVGCGTGRHLELLSDRFEVAGVDGSEAMLEVAGERLGEVPLHHGDMRTFELGRRFDVATCLFGGICLLGRLDEAVLAVRNMVGHLEKGGLFLLEPWVTREDFQEGLIDMRTHESGDSKVCIASVSELDGTVAHLDMQYLIATPDGIVHLEEPLAAGVWSVDEYAGMLEGAGLEVEHDPVGLDMGRGLWICRAR